MNASSTHRPRALDSFDRAILRILQDNNKTPQREIAARVNLSAAAVQRRISALEAAGVITRNVSIVDPNAIAPSITIVVEVHMQNDRSSVADATKELFRNTPEVQQCYYVTGGAGFLLIVLVRDMSAYEALARRLFGDNESVLTYRTLVVLDRVKTGVTVDIPDGE